MKTYLLKIKQWADMFIRGNGLIVFLVPFTVLAWYFNLTVPAFIIAMLIMSYVFFTQGDALYALPVLCVIAFMLPRKIEDVNEMKNYVYILYMLPLPLAGMVYFWFKNKIRFKKSLILIPALIFCASLPLFGIFSSSYTKWQNFMWIGAFAAIFIIPVTYLFCTVKKLEFDYLAKCLLAAGLVVCIELAVFYLTSTADELRFVFENKKLSLGWGTSNNIAAPISMCLPAAFYLATVKRFNFLYIIAGFVMLGFILLTMSRGLVLISVVLIPAAMYFVWRHSPAEQKKSALTAMAACTAVLAAVIIWSVGSDSAWARFLREASLTDRGRFPLFKEALNLFKENPLTGVGFGHDNKKTLNFPGYAVHNTVLQLLASGGILGLLTGLYFLVKRYMLFYVDPKPAHAFFLISMLFCDVYGMMELTFFGPFTIVMTCFIFLAVEQNLPAGAKAVKLLDFKQLAGKNKE